MSLLSTNYVIPFGRLVMFFSKRVIRKRISISRAVEIRFTILGNYSQGLPFLPHHRHSVERINIKYIANRLMSKVKINGGAR